MINHGLKVMDSTAITFCMDNDLPIVVFDMSRPGSLRAIVEGHTVGTIVQRQRDPLVTLAA